MEKKKVIFDVDTGSDDTVALVTGMLSEELEIVGICSVNGNRCVDYTTENTLRVVEFMGNKYPVYRGCAYPFSATLGYQSARPGYPRRKGTGPANNAGVHGDFIDQLPTATIKEQATPAAVFYIEYLMSQPDYSITLIPLGPLTNIAHAVAIEPRIVTKVKEVMYMGGGYMIGNKSQFGEMNVWSDPEAAEIVMRAGFKNFTFVPLDATHEAYVTKAEADEIRDCGTKEGWLCGELSGSRIKGYSTWQAMMKDGKPIPDAAPVHDALCVCALHDPSVLTTIPAHCQVDLGRDQAYGMTLFDIFEINGRYDALAPNCRVAIHADREKYVQWLKDTCAKGRQQ